MPQTSRRNHYVPKWYQRGFLPSDGETLHYLDRHPERRELADGRTITGNSLRSLPPTRCFRQKDLYTTLFGPIVNDEIERFLFGPIDDTGAKAVRAFAAGDAQGIHRHFLAFFEYMDAQKLRTPKGLDWIAARYPDLGQFELMLEMQALRQMHCTMWAECVREIVSAEHSDVKFILSDHPVTTYNPACPPGSSRCQYPNDPSISLNGTQTVFALDADHCIILTNLEYAEDSVTVDPLASRQNARYSGSTLARTNSMIRTRTLKRDEVVTINSLLKARSRRFVAAHQREWLFPGRDDSPAWDDIGIVLHPPRSGLWDFGGEIFVGHEDGSISYRDGFGRSQPSHEYLKKKNLPLQPQSGQPCGCGSGRPYRKCCQGIAEDDRPPWDVYGIRERNQMFCNAVVDILGLNQGKRWDDVRRELHDDQVKRIHELLAFLWPPDTNLPHLLPRPDTRVFRAVYMGFVDPRTIIPGVVSSLPYFDEILVPNPFPHPGLISPEYSPTKSPRQHKSQMLKNVLALLTLQPFVDAGIVHLVPDPMEFNPDFRRQVAAMAEDRAADWHATHEEMQPGRALGEDDFQRGVARLPVEQLKTMIRQTDPRMDQEQLDGMVAQMKANLRDDPLALLQSVEDGPQGGQLQILRTINLEMALFLAQLTGSALYTDQSIHWRQIHDHARAAPDSRPQRWPSLTTQFANLTFPVELDDSINAEIRASGSLRQMRRFFRSCWNAALASDADTTGQVGKDLATELARAARRATLEWRAYPTKHDRSVQLDGHIKLSAPSGGFGMNSVHRLLATSDRSNYLSSVPLAFRLSIVGDPIQAPLL